MCHRIMSPRDINRSSILVEDDGTVEPVKLLWHISSRRQRQIRAPRCQVDN